MYSRLGRFPESGADLPSAVVEYVAGQVGVAPELLALYVWDDRNARHHQAQIRRHFGFRQCSVADADKLSEWLAVHMCEAERQHDRVRAELLARCRMERIEPPAQGRNDRIVRSAPRSAERELADRIAARPPSDVEAQLSVLITPRSEDDEDGTHSLIKSVPGNVSLESMLTELRKLRIIRNVGLPAALFADVAPKVLAGWRLGRWLSPRRICVSIRAVFG